MMRRWLRRRRYNHSRLALGVAAYVNRSETHCNVCGTKWIYNGPGVPDCACTMGGA